MFGYSYRNMFQLECQNVNSNSKMSLVGKLLYLVSKFVASLTAFCFLWHPFKGHSQITLHPWRKSLNKKFNYGVNKGYIIETVQDFLIKLGIKTLMHLLEISIFSLYNESVRLTKIMNNLVKDCKIRTFKVIFQCLTLVESFQIFFFCDEYFIRRSTFINLFF